MKSYIKNFVGLIPIILLLIMLYTVIDYNFSRAKLISAMTRQEEQIIDRFSILGDLMWSYSPELIEKMILIEMKQANILAIIVSDRNVLPKGKVKVNGKIQDYDDRVHTEILLSSFSETQLAIKKDDFRLGTVRIFLSDKGMKQQLNRELIQSIIQVSILFSLIVSGVYFFIIRKTKIDLNTANLDLEAKVKKRTTQLSDINEILKRLFLKKREAENQVRKLNTELEKRMKQRTRDVELANQELAAALEKLKTTQSSLILEAKMASLGRISSGLAHELKNPLNFINNFSKLIIDDLNNLCENLDSVDTKEEMIQILDELRKDAVNIFLHGSKATKIVAGMLNQARADTTPDVECAINKILNETVYLVQHSQKMKNPGWDVKLKEYYDPSLPSFRGNDEKLHRVFLNLLENAFYAIGEKKKTADDTYQPKLTIASRFVNKNIVITISDNGAGIPDKIKDKVFELFFTTKPPGDGSGIGLKNCYEIIVTGMNGNIFFESEEGLGTLFTITLPPGS